MEASDPVKCVARHLPCMDQAIEVPQRQPAPRAHDRDAAELRNDELCEQPP
eukprot:CAMPEP_0184382350 /NCGR_PEP_ID=MMETSP0007-20130409/6269_1 /TAXON_ID=97485 /ORGANISM="Prymnesium parvum, Strain Texoma1" /LENGTH=50 /DNA_ID=CAMNT_0026728361 /DNA_START=268 /DNA_END=417 /DNA_ORIENTATION=+